MSSSRVILALEPADGTLVEDLTSLGVVVVRLYSPDEVADVLDQGTFDLCVVFAVDPRMEEVLHQLRASPAGAVMPVLVVGGPETSVTNRDRALELGADAFVGSDEGQDEVLARVEMLSGRPSTEPQSPAAAIDPVEEALAAAEAVAPQAGSSDANGEPAKVAVGESSLQQIIDRVEARISASPPIVTSSVESATDADPLAALDIEADLGRPPRTDSEPPVPTPAPEVPSKTDDDVAADDDDETLIYVPETEDEPTLPGTPASVAEAGGVRRDTPEPLPEVPPKLESAEASGGGGPAKADEDEVTLTGVPAEPTVGELELEEEEEEPASADTEAKAEAPEGSSTESASAEATEGTSTESASAPGGATAGSSRSDRVSEPMPASPGDSDTGTLDKEPLWSLLARALADRRSGALVLVSRGIERKVFLDEGEPVMAVSSAREDRLIELLYREGRLSENQYQQAVMTIGASGRRAGVILMEKGLITPRELFPLVRHHYETLLFDTFTWREGEWRLDPSLTATGERILLDVPAGALIVEGIRLRSTPAEVDALILPGAMPLRVENGICPLEKVDLPPEELGLLEACDGTKTTGELAQGFGMAEEEVRTLLAGLVVLGWVRPIGGDESAAVPDSAVFKPVSEASELRVERARVADKLAQVDDGTYFSILEIAPEASGYEIRKAYRRLRGQFATERFAVSELSDLQRDVEVIRFVLDEAYEVLRDPAVREAYRLAIGAR